MWLLDNMVSCYGVGGVTYYLEVLSGWSSGGEKQ